MDKEIALQKHREWAGKLEIAPRCSVRTREALSYAYTPGVAEPCLEISRDVDLSYVYTRRWNLVAVVTDGTAVLGLGDIGPEAGMPVMEGKCVLFKEYGGVDAFPLCIRSKNVDEIVNTVSLIAGSFGGINLEDISAPRCFEVERKLKEKLDIPVFHDDQHGTAVVVLAAMLNALRVKGKDISEIRAVVNGAGAAGTAITKLLLSSGLGDVVLCDKNGALCEGDETLSPAHKEMAGLTNREKRKGLLKDVIKGADVFIGVSAPNVVTKDMIRSMAEKPVVFAMANPVPEIMPEAAIEAGAYIVGSGRSDYPNQINNVLVFPAMFRGALDVRAKEINEEMKLAAARAIASVLSDDELNENNILPSAFDERILPVVSKAVADAARRTNVARI